jgi:hypothetical protein
MDERDGWQTRALSSSVSGSSFNSIARDAQKASRTDVRSQRENDRWRSSWHDAGHDRMEWAVRPTPALSTLYAAMCDRK